MRIVNKLRIGVLLIGLVIFAACEGNQDKLIAENEQLKMENANYRIQLDSLNQKVSDLVWELDAQRQITTKNASIASRGMKPIDLSWDGSK